MAIGWTGAGAIACGVLGSAVAGAVSNLWRTKVQKKEPFTWKGFITETAIGAATGAIGGPVLGAIARGIAPTATAAASSAIKGRPRGLLSERRTLLPRQPAHVLVGPGAVPDPHLQGVQREVGTQGLRQLPADHFAGEHVDDVRRIRPAGERPAVGDVSDPQLVRDGRGEVALHQVRRVSGSAPGTVVRGPLARVMPRNPAVRISRSTVHRATWWPWRRSLACTLRAP